MKSNLKCKKIATRIYNKRWHINKLNKDKNNNRFDELKNNINIKKKIDINKRSAIPKSTVIDAAWKSLKGNKTIVSKKEWITEEIISSIEEISTYSPEKIFRRET